MDRTQIDESIDALYRDKKWIVTADIAAGATTIVDGLKDHGAEKIMVVSGIEGVGELPKADRIAYTRSTGDTIMGGFRAFHDSIEQPSESLLNSVDAFDPACTARVRGQGFARQNTLAGRTVYGRRPKSWGDLEDKTTVDALWRAAGLSIAPSVVVPLEEAPTASAELGTELGTVWAADNRDGWHGGGEYTKWVKDPSDVSSTVAWLDGRTTNVRVMPFLDGLPCSIHGFITNDGVAVFNPVELYILRTLDSPGFYYARVGNLWEPPASGSKEMRAAVRSVADVLSREVGYLGSFGIDGVLTTEGFRPTELNPRMSVGSGIQWFGSGLPLADMELMLYEGDMEIDARWLESVVTGWAKGNRRASFMLPTTSPVTEQTEIGFRFGDGDVTAVDLDEQGEPSEETDGTMRIGPSNFGGVALVRLDSDRIERGPSTAPLAIPLMELARDLWDIDLPDCAAAPDVTR
ncbi:MAG: hypothetical protein ACR2N2_04450 [Acidimicrobiia bacterium]